MPDVILFACVHNAGRSQMAAAMFNALADPKKAIAISAGTQPGSTVHPEVLAAMKELGVDLSNAKPQKLTSELASTAKLLITMGCGETCPVVPGLKTEDWPLIDPKGKPIEEVRKIREEVRVRVNDLLKRSGWGKASSVSFPVACQYATAGVVILAAIAAVYVLRKR